MTGLKMHTVFASLLFLHSLILKRYLLHVRVSRCTSEQSHFPFSDVQDEPTVPSHLVVWMLHFSGQSCALTASIVLFRSLTSLTPSKIQNPSACVEQMTRHCTVPLAYSDLFCSLHGLLLLIVAEADIKALCCLFPSETAHVHVFV